MDADTGRGTDSKPGGSDEGTDMILLLGERSSTTDSFRGGCTAAGGWMGVGLGTKTLLSWVNGGTSKTEKVNKYSKYKEVSPLCYTFRRSKSKIIKDYILPISISSTEGEP